MQTGLSRMGALLRKETTQLLRDQSSLLIGILLPIVLIFIIGYGISMDVRKVPTAIVLEDASPTAHDALSFLNGSDYFEPKYVTSMPEAVRLMDKREADAIVRIPSDFTQALYEGRAQVQVVLYGVDQPVANIVRGYIESGFARWQAQPETRLRFSGTGQAVGRASITSRLWFNDANSSTWYFIPGLMAIILTLVGVFLTALVMAREWERGTLEAIFITPVRPLELLLAKMLPYFCIAMLGFTICMAAARFLFKVPIHGSLIIIFLSSMLYLVVALGIGITISAVTKSQFVACQLALVVSLLPTVMLTGFLFDLRSTPEIITLIGSVLPPTYYMQLLKTLFLAGNNWPMIIKNCTILALYAVLFMSIALRVTRKRLE